MRLACLAALLTGITYRDSSKSRLGSATGIGSNCAEAFTVLDKKQHYLKVDEPYPGTGSTVRAAWFPT